MSGPYDAIGRGLADFGYGIGRFIEKHKIGKSRLAAEREQQAKTKELIGQKTNYLKMQLGPDDTDLYNQLTEAENTPESLALLEPEVERRRGERDLKAKADAETKKLADADAKEQQTLERQTAIVRKQLEISQLPPEEKQKVEMFLDGTPEGLKAAQQQFSSWKPEKVDKQSIAEQKAQVMDDILSLGDNDLGKGMETAKANHPDLYRAALKFGIKVDKKDDPAADYVKQVLSDWSKSDEHKDDAMPLDQYAKKWIQEREKAIPLEAKTALLDMFSPERKGSGLMEGMKKAGFGAGTTNQVQPEGDAKRAEELSAKLHSDPSSLTDEELEWLDAYHKRQSGTATQ